MPDTARPRPVAGHRRAFWSSATLALNSLILSHLRPVGGGNSATARSPAANRQAAQRISDNIRSSEEDRACSKSSESRRMKTKSDVRVSGGMNSYDEDYCYGDYSPSRSQNIKRVLSLRGCFRRSSRSSSSLGGLV